MSDEGLIVNPLVNPGPYQGLSTSLGKTAFAGNVAAVTLAAAGRPAGMYRADIAIVATTLGSVAAAVANIIGTDAAGAFTQAALTVNLATTSRAQGSFNFQSTGAAAIQFSITGIVTPGALAATYEVVLTRIGP